MNANRTSVLVRLYYKYKHFILYSLIGISGATLDFFMFFILNKFFNVYYQYANFISISCGITNNFFLNAYLNFKKTDKILRRYSQFYIIGMLGWLISFGLLHVLIEKLSFNKILSKIITIAVITIIQFFLNKSLTFRKAKHNNTNR